MAPIQANQGFIHASLSEIFHTITNNSKIIQSFEWEIKGPKSNFMSVPPARRRSTYVVDGQGSIVAIPVGAFADPHFPSPRIFVYESRKHPGVTPSGSSAHSMSGWTLALDHRLLRKCPFHRRHHARPAQGRRARPRTRPHRARPDTHAPTIGPCSNCRPCPNPNVPDGRLPF